MNKERLLELGLTETQADSVIEMNKGFIPKYRYDEVATERDELKSQLKDRDDQLKNLSQNAEANEALKNEIDDLKKKNKEAEKEYEAKVEKIKKDNAIDNYLHNADVKNVGVVKKLLDLESVEFKDDKLNGLDEQLENLRQDESLNSLFNHSNSQGFKPFGNEPNRGNDTVKPKSIFEEINNLQNEEANRKNEYNPWG